MCETWCICDKDDENSVNTDDFQTYRKDRKYSEGGGLLLSTRNGISYKDDMILKLNSVYIETLWIENTLPNKNLHLSLMYRPPRDSILVEWLIHTKINFA